MSQAGKLIDRLKGMWSQQRGAEPDVTAAVYNLLAVLRFFSVATLGALVVTLVSRESTQADVGALTIVAVAYSVFMVVLRTRVGLHHRITYLLLVVDSAIATGGILVSGGMDSPFLLYALIPVLTAALLVNRFLALALAFVPGATVVLAHTVGSIYFHRFPWILEGNYLTLVPIYASVCFGIALLPFYANLNVRRLGQTAARRAEQLSLRAELHDKLAQNLSALTLGLRQLRRVGDLSQQVAELREISERSYDELRELLDLLEAGTWEPTAGGTLAHLVQAWAQETGIRVSSNLPDRDLGLPPEVTIALWGIVREALTNTGKHSGATRVWVELRVDADGTALSVRDNGRGFSQDQSTTGHGRKIMQERAAEIGATLQVTSAPSEGTEVLVSYPRHR
ncbi:MAG: Signal transduction histidine kinase [Dehalococcoidia bacterium]|nr:Signal transduction histidine kinase [Dehalococcoidia bacterium]